ncbi:TetR/AcrR family transcriptional regulator [Marinobacter halophilus]|uniref:TetR/AcrR family transcriptional regulator n=1 Tax=Marinobacter halophilus TaxID=1323740 RepID=A0A2T1KEH0_9GAMM|nr:TetR/AcrR family transcriptional regulator [Marinobacter halophilus]PSF08534.1 TetR/AcrR family transcriptional regulator [Marinobacter halophilus]GGC61452.1 TetR family transcriptional regulator [Marinobacter halophilus]
MPRKPKQDRARATVDAIVEAGFIALSQRGPAATTTRHIAEIAGVGVGSLYEYFENKEAIFSAMSQRFIADTAAMIKPLTPTLVQMPIDSAIRMLLNEFRNFLGRDDGRYLKCVRHAMAVDFELHLDPLFQVLNNVIMRYLTGHPETLRVSRIPAITYIGINGGIFAVIRHLSDPDPLVSFDEMADGLASMIGHYIEQELLLLRGVAE